MLLVSAITLARIATRPASPRADLVVWLFSDSHAAAARNGAAGVPSLVEMYKLRTGKTVDVQQLAYRAEEVRLLSMMLSPGTQRDVPDVVAIEIMSMGKFFRPPVQDVGLLPLNAYLQKRGWLDRILPARLAPYTKDGVIFGVPTDVHPVGIAYRKDLFDQAGVDPESAKTWPEFHDRLLAYQRYWRGKGYGDRYALELSATGVEWIIVLLLQRGVNVIDDHDEIHLTDPRVAQTMAFYTRLLAGTKRVAAHQIVSAAATRELGDGKFGAWLCPDWRPPYLRNYAPTLSGKIRLMPLPRFDPTDAPTGTWGGTMFGIPRDCKDPDAAFDLLEHLILSDEAVAALARVGAMLPAVPDRWAAPAYDAPSEFWGGQRVGRFYAQLAAQVPHRYVTPFTQLAMAEMTDVLGKALDAADAGREDELEGLISGWLAESAQSLKKRVDFGRFE